MDTGHKAFSRAESLMKQFQNRRKLKKKQSGCEAVFQTEYQRIGFKILHHPMFDAAMSVIILLNLALVIIETDAGAIGNDTSTVVQALSWMILIVFLLELVLRMVLLQSDFWLDGVNVCDFVLVVLDTVLNILGLILGSLFPVSFLRIIRLSKLARVAKAFNKFPELRLLVAGLLGSMRAIFWGAVLLTFTLLTFSIIAVQFIHPLNQQVTNSGAYEGNCERCPRAYASVFDAMLTLCQTIVAGDAWGQVMPIIESDPNSTIFFVSSFMCIGMAVLNLIFGVVLDAASEARSKLSDEIRDQELVAKLEVQSHLLELCTALDKTGTGEIHYDDISAGFDEQGQFSEALGSMDVHKEDLEVLWTILDENRSGSVSYTEFVTSCYKLKSSNTHFMLAYIKFYIAVIKDKICAQLDEVQHDLKESEHRIEEEMKQEEQKLMHEVEALEQANEEGTATIVTEVKSTAQSAKRKQEEQMSHDAEQQFLDIKRSIAQLSLELQAVLKGSCKSVPILPEAGNGAGKIKFNL